MREAISAPEIPQEAKLRLAILYALRYQKAPGQQIAGVVDLLKQQGVPEAEVRRLPDYVITPVPLASETC